MFEGNSSALDKIFKVDRKKAPKSPEEALEHLDEACNLGFDDKKLLERDKDLASLRDDPRFLAFVQRRFGDPD